MEELDDDGWRIASTEQRIVELGALGEGAGGSVTRAQLKGGTTIFALKVRFETLAGPLPESCAGLTRYLSFPGHHDQPRCRRQEADRT